MCDILFLMGPCVWAFWYRLRREPALGFQIHVQGHRQRFGRVAVLGVHGNREGDGFPPASIHPCVLMFRGQNRMGTFYTWRGSGRHLSGVFVLGSALKEKGDCGSMNKTAKQGIIACEQDITMQSIRNVSCVSCVSCVS